MKQPIAIMIFIFALIPFLSADLIEPGFHNIPVINNITNFNDLSDYYFLTVCKSPMEKVSLIEEGIIGNCYKFSQLSVYAVKKSDFNLADIEKISELNSSEFTVFFNQSKFKEVLSDVEHYKTVPVSSTVKGIYKEYAIDINKLKSEPNNVIIERNKLIYYYTLIPLIVLVIILIIILRKRKNVSA
jgi:hypothetical protein